MLGNEYQEIKKHQEPRSLVCDRVPKICSKTLLEEFFFKDGRLMIFYILLSCISLSIDLDISPNAAHAMHASTAD